MNKSWHCLLLIAVALLSGCAQFRFQGYRTVKRSPERVGPSVDRLLGYGRLEVKKPYPSESSPILHVYLEKKIARTMRYNRNTYQEEVYKKQVSRFEAFYKKYWVWYFCTQLALFIAEGERALPIAAVIALTVPIVEDKPKPEFQYHRVQGSGDVETYYREYERDVPAIGEPLVIDELTTVHTDTNGCARISFSPSRFDTGIKINHAASGGLYLVRRVQRERTVEARWVKTVEMLGLVGGTANTIIKIVKKARAGLGPQAYIITLVVDVAGTKIFSYAVRKLGTITEQYYDWVIIKIEKQSK